MGIKFKEIRDINEIPLYPSVTTNVYLVFISEGDVIGSDTWDVRHEANEIVLYDSFGDKSTIYFNNTRYNDKCFVIEYQ